MTAETIEGEVHTLVPLPERGIQATGALALAALTDDEFDRRLAALKTGVERIGRIQRALMTADVHYGVIPGTKKPTLLKPGAEVLCLAYSLAADFNPERRIGDSATAPALSYVTRCDLHLGDLDGPVVAVGYGAANSWEARYRYRTAERVCPSCGVPAIIKGKAEYGGGWVCFKKKGGCGAKYGDSDQAIVGQETGQVDNPDPWDLDVTLAKMAEKRAHVDATLRATGASALFTQDMEDQRTPDPSPESVDPDTGEVMRDGSLIGTVHKEKKLTTDYALRQSPDGWFLGFRLKAGSGSGVICEARGPLAEQVAAWEDSIVGKRVQVWGAFVSYDRPTVEHPYRALRLDRLTVGDLSLPSDDVANADAARGGAVQEPTAEPSAPTASGPTKEADREPAAPDDTALGADVTTEAGDSNPAPSPALCGSPSPYGDGLACSLMSDHTGPHKNLEAAFPTTWTD